MGVTHCVTFDYSARTVILNEYTRQVASAFWSAGREQTLPFDNIAGFWYITTCTTTGLSWFQPVVALKKHGGNYNWVLNKGEMMYWEQGDVLPLTFHGRFSGRIRRHLNGVVVESNPAAQSLSATAVGIDVLATNHNHNHNHKETGKMPNRYQQVRYYAKFEDLEPRLRLLNEFLLGRPVADWELQPPVAGSDLPLKLAPCPAQPRADSLSSNSTDSTQTNDIDIALAIHIAGINHSSAHADAQAGSTPEMSFDFAFIDTLPDIGREFGTRSGPQRANQHSLDESCCELCCDVSSDLTESCGNGGDCDCHLCDCNCECGNCECNCDCDD